MPLPKLPKAEKACKPIVVTKEQHKAIHRIAKKKRLRVTEVITVMLNQIKEWCE